MVQKRLLLENTSTPENSTHPHLSKTHDHIKSTNQPSAPSPSPQPNPLQPLNLKHFIEEELYLCSKLRRKTEGGVPTTEYTHKLEMIKDIEMINSNNFRSNKLLSPQTLVDKDLIKSQFNESISRVDEYDSSDTSNFNVVFEERQPRISVKSKFDFKGSSMSSQSDYGQFLQANNPCDQNNKGQNSSFKNNKNKSQRSIAIRKSLASLHSSHGSNKKYSTKKRINKSMLL